MILQVNQIKSSGKNIFEVIENEQQLYTVESPWVPVVTDKTRKITMTNFTVYYDFMYHNNAGKVMVGYSVSVKYTYSKNCKMYNPHFIRDNFGEEEAERVRQIGKTWTGIDGENRKASLRMFWIIFGSCWAVGILVTLIILSNLFWF